MNYYSIPFALNPKIRVSYVYIVSEKLKKEIEDTGCKGIEFMPIEMKMTDWLQGGEREKIYGKA